MLIAATVTADMMRDSVQDVAARVRSLFISRLGSFAVRHSSKLPKLFVGVSF